MNKLVVVLLLTSQTLFAAQFVEINPQNGGIKNPQMRVCRQIGGYFSAHDIAYDNVGFCSIGSATVGANDLVMASQGIMSSAISAYLNETTQGIASCAQAGASDRTSSTLNGIMCQFNDNSWISLATLSQGKNSAMNSGLNRALSQLGL